MGRLLLILLIIALLILMSRELIRRWRGATPPPPPALPPAYPQVSSSTSYAAGVPLIPQGSWSGPGRQQRATSASYVFLRRNYNPAAPGDPYSAAPNVPLRIRLIVPPGEQAEITNVEPGGAAPGTGWWAGATDNQGEVRVTVRVELREVDIDAETILEIVAEELDLDLSDPNATPQRGAVHEVRIVPPGG